MRGALLEGGGGPILSSLSLFFFLFSDLPSSSSSSSSSSKNIKQKIPKIDRTLNPQVAVPTLGQRNRPRLQDWLAIPIARRLGVARGVRSVLDWLVWRHQLVRHSRQAGHHHAERYSIGEKNQRRTRVNPWTCVLFSPRALSCSSWVAWKRAPEEDKRKEESSIFLNQYHKLCKCKKYLNNQSNLNPTMCYYCSINITLLMSSIWCKLRRNLC